MILGTRRLYYGYTTWTVLATASPMNAPSITAGDTAVLAEVREGLARPFAEAIDARLPEVIELLEQQLALTTERSKWKPLRGALELLKGARPTLPSQVAKEVAERFDAKVRPGESAFGATTAFSVDSLSLVADDEVQKGIALGNATKRLKDQLGDELFVLTQRLAAVMGRDALTDEENPAYPRILARGLLAAIEKSESDAASRFAALSAFEPVLLGVVGEIYHAVNLRLRNRGILPDFKRTYGAPVQKPAPAAAAAAAAAIAQPSAPAGGASRAAQREIPASSPAGMLERLFAAAEHPAPAPIAPPPAPAAQGMVTIQIRPELIEALHALESRLAAAPAQAAPPGPIEEAAPGEVFDIATPIAERTGSAAVRRAKGEMREALTPADAVVADLVAALFDRLFVDARLSDATKAQVGRLQLPVFKAVMQDRTFFADREHPIRKLIDVIAELGAADEAILVDGRAPDAWIAGEVGKLAQTHGDDAKAFRRTHERLAHALERHRETAIDRDEQVQAIRDNEKRLTAVRESTLAIAHRLEGGHYPQECASFLYRSWRDVLLFDFEHGADQGADWKADIEVLDDTLWVLTPHSSKEDRARLASLLPSVLFRMKLGFKRAEIPESEALAFTEELKELLDAIVSRPAAAAHDAALRKAAAAAPLLPEDYTATMHVSSGAMTEEGFVRGTWVEFTEADGVRRRCRLNWLSQVQGTCVFKDLEKNRSFAISLEELREKRRAGLAVIVDGPGVAQSSIDGAIADVARGMGAT